MKKLWNKILLAWYLLGSDNHLLVTNTKFYTSIKNLDMIEPNYMCLENSEGGYDVVYPVVWNNGKKVFTITVARFKGANAGQIVDATLLALNKHIVSDTQINGDQPCQPEPSDYVKYINE